MSPDAHYDLSSLLLATFFILEFFYYMLLFDALSRFVLARSVLRAPYG